MFDIYEQISLLNKSYSMPATIYIADFSIKQRDFACSHQYEKVVNSAVTTVALEFWRHNISHYWCVEEWRLISCCLLSKKSYFTSLSRTLVKLCWPLMVANTQNFRMNKSFKLLSKAIIVFGFSCCKPSRIKSLKSFIRYLEENCLNLQNRALT